MKMSLDIPQVLHVTMDGHRLSSEKKETKQKCHGKFRWLFSQPKKSGKVQSRTEKYEEKTLIGLKVKDENQRKSQTFGGWNNLAAKNAFFEQIARLKGEKAPAKVARKIAKKAEDDRFYSPDINNNSDDDAAVVNPNLKKRKKSWNNFTNGSKNVLKDLEVRDQENSSKTAMKYLYSQKPLKQRDVTRFAGKKVCETADLTFEKALSNHAESNIISSKASRKPRNLIFNEFGSGPDLTTVEKSVRFSLPSHKVKKRNSSSVGNLCNVFPPSPQGQLAEEQNFCQHVNASDSHGRHQCLILHPDECSHCAEGTMSLNRKHLCRHGGQGKCKLRHQKTTCLEENDPWDDNPIMSWESACLYENTG